MASSSGNSASEEGLMEQRKRKRMQSNRESARRSRMRKQKHLDDLMAQVAQLHKENAQILSSVDLTTQHFLNLEAQNSVLRAQMAELTQRLQSLNDMLNFVNPSVTAGSCMVESEEGFGDVQSLRMRRWLASSPKSVLHKLLKIYAQSSNGALCGSIPHVQPAVIHSSNRLQHSTAAYRCSSLGRHANFSHYEMLLSRRFIHATGAYQSPERNYYETLGVSKDATPDEIKKAFHALAKKYHPDANKNNPSAKRKFQEIREAYETLKDPEKKMHYDRMRQSSKTKGSKTAEDFNSDWNHFRHARGPQFSDSFHKIFSEIFENETESSGGDIQVELVLTFSEAAKGCTKHLSFDADVPCHSCDGRGHPLDAMTIMCPTCRGIGRVTIPPFTTTCSTCKGVGRLIKEYCTTCGGSGVYKGVRDVRVTIPAGVDVGDSIRVPKAGNSGGWESSSGDLIIKLKVAEDPVFSRKGADLYVNKYISFTQAILGGSIEVPTLYGKKQLTIPKGVQHGQLVKLRGKGLPKSGFLVDHGDQYVRFCINLPLNVTERQRSILEEFEKEQMDEDNASTASSWWQYWVKRSAWPQFVLEFSILTMILLFLLKVLN